MHLVINMDKTNLIREEKTKDEEKEEKERKEKKKVV